MKHLLRQRFFASLAEQSSLMIPVLGDGDSIETPLFKVDDPFIYTADGDFFIHWQCGTNKMAKEWFDSVYLSGYRTIVVFEELIPEEATKDDFDCLVREGCYFADDYFVSIYNRVF